MPAGKDFFNGDEVAQGFAHFLAVDGNEVIVNPVSGLMVGLGAKASVGLRDFGFVVRENQVHSAAVNVKGQPEIVNAHGGALYVPSGKASSPG